MITYVMIYEWVEINTENVFAREKKTNFNKK